MQPNNYDVVIARADIGPRVHGMSKMTHVQRPMNTACEHGCVYRALVRSHVNSVVRRDLVMIGSRQQLCLLDTGYAIYNKPVGFYAPIAPPVPNAPELQLLHAAVPPVQSEYPVKRRAAAAVPLPESP